MICATNTGGTGKYYLYDSSAGGSVKAVDQHLDRVADLRLIHRSVTGWRRAPAAPPASVRTHRDDRGGPTMPQPLLLGIVGLLGLAVGSFLNVVIYRVPRGESLVRPGLALPALRHRGPQPAQRPGARLADAARAVRRLPRPRSAPATRSSRPAPRRCSSPWRRRFGWSWELPAYLYLAAIADRAGR